jgi:acyl-CoA synthetase (AMP-forming)/AMP-acid ligase II
MAGYWRNPQASAASIAADRWLRTGAVGKRVEGRLYINSRARDLILRGAENVYPVEIEQRLEAHPDVLEAAVVGVDHEELGQEVKAIVCCGPARATSAELAPGAACLLPQGPRTGSCAEPLPRNATGKVLKNVLPARPGIRCRRVVHCRARTRSGRRMDRWSRSVAATRAGACASRSRPA